MCRLPVGRRPNVRANHVRRSAPTTSAACCARPSCSRRARRTPPAGSTTTSCAAAEDEAIRDVVRMQEDVGLQSVTDGEFRRASWHMDFIYSLDGVSKAPGNLSVQFHNAEGDIEFTPAALHIDGKLGVSRDDLRRARSSSCSRSRATARRRSSRSPRRAWSTTAAAAPPIDESVYPDMDGFWDDLDRGLRRGGPAPRRARLHATCSSTTRASPTSTTRDSAR